MQSSLYENNNSDKTDSNDDGLVNSECLKSSSISTVYTHRKLNAFMFEHVFERNTELPCLLHLTDNFEANSVLSQNVGTHVVRKVLERHRRWANMTKNNKEIECPFDMQKA